MYQQDTILRQIEMLTQALARIFFRKEKVVYEFPEQETGYSDDDVWYARILRLLASSEINAAEDALFDGFDASSVRLRAALDFYSESLKRRSACPCELQPGGDRTGIGRHRGALRR